MKTNYFRLALAVLVCCSFLNLARGQEHTVTSAVSEICSAPGWASENNGTRGGGNATPVVARTYMELISAVKDKKIKVVQIDGTIAIPSGGRISFQDQTGKTIFGSPGAKLVSSDQTKDSSGIIYVKRCKDIIIRNLIFEGPGGYDVDGWDNATLDACNNVWIDHCEFRDGIDGNFDIKNTADFITVSYCKFAYLKPPKAGGPGGADDHRYSDLIGSADDMISDKGHFRITFMRCWWAEGCVARMPRVRFGQVHILNNFYNSTVSQSCIQAGFQADLFVQANVFEKVSRPIDLMHKDSRAVQSVDNIFTDIKGNNTGDGRTAFVPPYRISVLNAAKVKAEVTKTNGAGATLTGNTCQDYH